MSESVVNVESTSTEPTNVEVVKGQVIKEAQEMLKAGKTREEIRLHYGLTKAQNSRMFKDPELKGKKTHKGKYTIVKSKKKTILDPFAIIASKNQVSTPAIAQEPTPVAEVENTPESAPVAPTPALEFSKGWDA